MIQSQGLAPGAEDSTAEGVVMKGAWWWVTAAIIGFHGLIHLLGAVKGFGWADVEALSSSISVLAAAFWLLAATLVIASAVTLALGPPRWWAALAAPAAIVSQVMVISSWSDAKAGTAANVVLLGAAIWTTASQGSRGLGAGGRPRTRRVTRTGAPKS
ncbi:hypothetical protein LTH96_04620 [Nesterenkonia sp. LB17]|uniref:hypothetical protein n=1 Tax=unclassified Nesterenkonia TaxID=2629769 RepID=UPI001F4CDEC5|nr:MULTISPECIES: hypothetical protein [unclassified Nesterenkonia]MCH8559275.1 hypothetical protein [Nesterenkonia sp. DZ6]MCH8563162.1 hypothetical protein [Nesterenkonia sp. YGD6]MCH8565022.1 hypothetical protein [Nesterenkonia sp. LB17]